MISLNRQSPRLGDIFEKHQFAKQHWYLWFFGFLKNVQFWASFFSESTRFFKIERLVRTGICIFGASEIPSPHWYLRFRNFEKNIHKTHHQGDIWPDIEGLLCIGICDFWVFDPYSALVSAIWGFRREHFLRRFWDLKSSKITIS